MQKLINLFLMLVLSAQAFAQTQIKGTVRDGQGQTIPGANVYLKDTFDGAVSLEDGTFSFETYEEGKQILVISFIGFKTLEKSISVEGKLITLELQLEEEINKVDGVTITAGSYEAGDVKKNTVLKPLDIATTASAVGDIMGAINTLPGTATVGESGRLFVRGGEGYETKVFIDGLEVRNAFGATAPNVPTRGRFSPFLFKGTSFSTGGYSAEYGQALSSALILNSNDMPIESQADISLMSVGGDVAYTQKWERTSISGKVQYTDLRPYQNVVKQFFNWDEAPNGHVSELVFRQQVRENGLLKLYVNSDNSGFIICQPNINKQNVPDTVGINNNYLYINASYKDILNSKWTVKGGISSTRNKNNLDFNQQNIDDLDQAIHTKLTLQWDASEKLAVNMGSEWFNTHYERDIWSKDSSPYGSSIKDNSFGNFVEADYFASNKFVVRTGLRHEYTSITNQHFLSPRVAMSYKLNNEGQFSLAYGQFVQAPQNEYSIVQPALKPERATHYILNYQRIKNDRIFRIETYYKDYEDLVKFENQMDFDPSNYNNYGYGSAKGLDVFWRDNKTIKNTDYWVSYSYVDSEREYQNFDQLMTPSFLSAHNFSVVVKHMIDPIRTQVGAAYNFASPRPFHNPNKPGFQNSQTPQYHDFSLNAAVLIKQNIILYCSASNIFGRNNIFGYEYAEQANDQGVFESRAIGQGAKRFVFIGLFITLTKNKQANQLDNL